MVISEQVKEFKKINSIRTEFIEDLKTFKRHLLTHLLALKIENPKTDLGKLLYNTCFDEIKFVRENLNFICNGLLKTIFLPTEKDIDISLYQEYRFKIHALLFLYDLTKTEREIFYQKFILKKSNKAIYDKNKRMNMRSTTVDGMIHGRIKEHLLDNAANILSKTIFKAKPNLKYCSVGDLCEEIFNNVPANAQQICEQLINTLNKMSKKNKIANEKYFVGLYEKLM